MMYDFVAFAVEPAGPKGPEGKKLFLIRVGAGFWSKNFPGYSTKLRGIHLRDLYWEDFHARRLSN